MFASSNGNSRKIARRQHALDISSLATTEQPFSRVRHSTSSSDRAALAARRPAPRRRASPRTPRAFRLRHGGCPDRLLVLRSPLRQADWDERVKEHFWLPPDTDVDIALFYQQAPSRRPRADAAGARSRRSPTALATTLSTAPSPRTERCAGFAPSGAPPTPTTAPVRGSTASPRTSPAQRRTEAELRERESSFAAFADSIPALAWIANADGWIFWYNRRWYDYTGTTPEQMEGWGWQAVHDPAMLPSVMSAGLSRSPAASPFR